MTTLLERYPVFYRISLELFKLSSLSFEREIAKDDDIKKQAKALSYPQMKSNAMYFLNDISWQSFTLRSKERNFREKKQILKVCAVALKHIIQYLSNSSCVSAELGESSFGLRWLIFTVCDKYS